MPRYLRLFCLLTVLSAVLTACENDPKDVAAFMPQYETSAEVIQDFRTVYSDSAAIKVRVSGPEMISMRENNDQVQRFPQGVLVEFFSSDGSGRVESTLASRYAVRYENQDLVVLRDSVVWQAASGDRLESEELNWDAVSHEIYSDRFVRLRQGKQQITGVGFEAAEDFSRSRIKAIQGIVSVTD